MIRGIQDAARKSVERVKWFASFLSDRINVEIAVFRLIFRANGMEKERDRLLHLIGEKIVELSREKEKNVFRDKVISEAISELHKIDDEIAELKNKASEISSLGG